MANPLDVNLASPCGTYCGECKHLKQGCPGCGYVKGKPFWGQCRFYSCVREKGVEHCGLCGDFPCTYFMTTFDPNEGQHRIFYRAGQLVYRKKIGTKAWIEEKSKSDSIDPKYQNK